MSIPERDRGVPAGPTLDAADLEALRGLGVPLSLEEVAHTWLPVVRLLDGRIRAAARRPYLIGLAGSVAVGKSTFGRVLRALLARLPDTPQVELVATDGFLYPNAELARRGLLERKGFPESYDRPALLAFVAALKSGAEDVSCPVYSHRLYDVVPDERLVLHRPDIVIVEGLNVLQSGTGTAFVGDFFDFSIYLDAPIAQIRDWYVDRFRRLRDTSFREPDSYFHRYADLDDDAANARASAIWTAINEKNLVENILPTRERATLVVELGPDHRTTRVHLRE